MNSKMFDKNLYLLNGRLFLNDKKKKKDIKNEKSLQKKTINKEKYKNPSDFMKFQWSWTL